MITAKRFGLFVVGLLLIAPMVSSAQKEQEKPQILATADADLQVVSDKSEGIPAFFKRQHIIVGGLQRDKCESLLTAAKPVEKIFLNYASYNDDKTKTALFGATVTIAPMQEEAKKLVKEYLAKHKDAFGATLIVRRDAKEETVYHVVGVTTRSSVGFFDQKKRVGKDDFSQAELMFHDGK